MTSGWSRYDSLRVAIAAAVIAWLVVFVLVGRPWMRDASHVILGLTIAAAGLIDMETRRSRWFFASSGIVIAVAGALNGTGVVDYVLDHTLG